MGSAVQESTGIEQLGISSTTEICAARHDNLLVPEDNFAPEANGEVGMDVPSHQNEAADGGAEKADEAAHSPEVIEEHALDAGEEPVDSAEAEQLHTPFVIDEMF